MTRVSTFVRSQTLTADLLRLNQQQFTTQKQITSGKVADQFADIPRDTNSLLAARGVEARIDLYKRAADETRVRVELQDTHLTEIGANADELREAVTRAVALGNAGTLIAEVTAAFENTVDLLNSDFNGKFLYGGGRTDQPPVTSDSLADLVAATAASDLFANNTLKPSVQVDDKVTVEYGVLADEVGQELFDLIKRIADFDVGPDGPFGDQLTPAQETFLNSELANLTTVTRNINLEIAHNGINQQQLERVIERHETGDLFIKTLISGIEDVDLAEAITRLNNEQVALEATTRVLADLGRLSLLDFI